MLKNMYSTEKVSTSSGNVLAQVMYSLFSLNSIKLMQAIVNVNWTICVVGFGLVPSAAFIQNTY